MGIKAIAILKDTAGNTIGARLNIGGLIKNIETKQLAELKGKEKASNAIIDKHGYIRSKKGTMPVIVINTSVKSVHGIRRNTLTLYHGSGSQILKPKFGLGQDKHDYGRGLYTTTDYNLACEWAASSSNGVSGWCHTLELNTGGLSILDFDKVGVEAWIAELMKHRDGSDSIRYKRNAKEYIKCFGVDTSKYDIIKGWRADASYFYIAKRYIADELDTNLLPDILRLGELGIQICIKSEKAFRQLRVLDSADNVNYNISMKKYNDRDIRARENMYKLVNSSRNTLKNVASTALKRRGRDV